MPDNTENRLNKELPDSERQLAKLDDRQKHKDNLLGRYTRDFLLLDLAVRTLSETGDLNILMQKAVDVILEAGKLEYGALYLLDKDSNKPTLLTRSESSDRLKEIWSKIPLTARIPAEAIEARHIVTLQDVLQNIPVNGDQKRTLEREDVGTLVCVPLKSRDRTIGIVTAGARKRRKFTTEDIHLLETLGCQIGLAIEHGRLLEESGRLSMLDDLTGLYSLRYLEEALENEIYRSQRCGDPFSLVMMDLDGFKDYNETFGQLGGDRALQALARTLKLELRKTDIACRYGGDEFSIVLPATDAQKAQKVVDRIRSAYLQMDCIQPFHIQSPLGLSAGIAQFPQAAVTGQNMIYLADSALHYARKNKKNKSVLISNLVLVASSPTHREAQQVYSLVSFVETRERYTIGHAKNVSILSDLIGKAIGLPVKELYKLRTAAFLHDIGKVRIPASLLTKPDKLTREEREIMNSHSLEGARLVARAAELKKLVPAVKHHHERYDGAGYPTGLKGDQIPFLSRIICIADAYDTMVSHRSYSEAMSPDEALGELYKCSGTQFDPELVNALVAVSDSIN